MKVHIDLPWGGSLDIERKPVSKERANLMAGVIFAVIGAVTVIKFFTILATA